MPPTVGKLRTALLFVDFADSPGAESVDGIYTTFSQRIVDWYLASTVIDDVPLRVDGARIHSWGRLR